MRRGFLQVVDSRHSPVLPATATTAAFPRGTSTMHKLNEDGGSTPGTSTGSSGGKPMSCSYYKRTYDEAIKYRSTLPDFELFDLETGLLKEKYRRLRSPSPPSGTPVYEVGTGRRYTYITGTTLSRMMPGTMGMNMMRRDAANAGVLPRHLLENWEEERTRSKTTANATAPYTCLRCATPMALERPKMRLRSKLPFPSLTTTTSSTTTTTTDSSKQKPLPHSRRLEDPSSSTHVQLEDRSSSTHQLEDRSSSTQDRSSSTHICSCIALVTTDSIRLETYKPDLLDINKSDIDLLSKSVTLRYLSVGYHNYVENNTLDAAHLLTAYTCRSKRLKQYNAYKSITCKENTDEQPRTSYIKHSEVAIYKLLAMVNQYIGVFAVLGDFNYTWLTPAIKSGVCNAMVVDKYWFYSSVRQVYVPYYRLLPGDEYTDFAVSEIRKLKYKGTRIKNLQFVSTENTRLYTNRNALVNHRSTYTTPRPPSTYTTPRPPPKKRRYTPEEEGEKGQTLYDLHIAGDWDDTTDTGDETITEPSPYQDLDIQPTLASEVKNPTLVVFKHNLDENKPDTLLCNITVEMGLTDTLQY